MKPSFCPLCAEPITVPNLSFDQMHFCVPCFDRLIYQSRYPSPIPQGFLAIDMVRTHFEQNTYRKFMVSVFPEGLPNAKELP